MSYVTTNVRLEEDLHRALKHLAVERGTSAAEIVREAIRRFIEKPPPPEKEWSIEDDPFWKVIGICKDGPIDGSINHDHYLYGWPRVVEIEELKKRRKKK